MTHFESSQVEGTDLEPRDARALTEYHSVLEDVGRVRGAADLYLVVSQSGKEYLVDARSGTCECPDHQKRGVRCKHARRVAFATGEVAIPAWVDRESIDPSLGAHVDAIPRVVAADGGQVLDDVDENDDGGRPDGCECHPDDTLPCFTCWMADHDTPNPDADADE